jgi:predicted dehydrogenase
VRQIEIGIIGTGWCGGIRAEACAASASVKALHIAEIRPDRLKEVAEQAKAKTATLDYRDLLRIPEIEAIFISTTPETTHYPIARDCLTAGKHVLLEKPISLEMWEADDLIDIAKRRNLKFTIGYSQRYNPKYAYVKKAIGDGMLGTPLSALVSRHLSRSLGNKISGRIKLSPAVMEATHDLDFLLWCFEPAKPVKVYSQAVYHVKKDTHGVSDCQWIMVTLDSGAVITVGAGWILPPGYPNFSSTWIEIVGSEGSLMIDDTHKDVALNTLKGGLQHPMSTMPGESVGHVFAGPMADETIRFVDAAANDTPVLVTPEQARLVMDVYTAADLSVETGEPVALPLQRGAR